jgi:hypothetical protein
LIYGILIVLHVLLAVYFLFCLMRTFRAIQEARSYPKPLNITEFSAQDAPPLSPLLVEPDAILKEAGFRYVGAVTFQIAVRTPIATEYQYLSPDGTINARLGLPFPSEYGFSLISRLADNSCLFTQFLMGEKLQKADVELAYATHDPHAAIAYHQRRVIEWSQEKGTSAQDSLLGDNSDGDEWFAATFWRERKKSPLRVRWLFVVIYSLVIMLNIGAAIFIWLNDNVTMLHALLLCIPWLAALEMHLLHTTLRVGQPLDYDLIRALPPTEQKQKLPFSYWKFARTCLIIAGIVAIPTYYYWDASGERIHQLDATTLESVQSLPGATTLAIAVTDDGAVWRVTYSGIERWESREWVTVFTEQRLLPQLTADGNRIWALTPVSIISCEVQTSTCAIAETIDGGFALAANDGKVLVLTHPGVVHALENDQWSTYKLQDTLREFRLEAISSQFARVAITEDGTEWISWHQLWRRPTNSSEWRPVRFEQESSTPVFIIGSAGNDVWLLWSTSVSRVDSRLEFTDDYTWEVIGHDLSTGSTTLTGTGDDNVWAPTTGGVIHFDGTDWIAVPNRQLQPANDLAITADGQVWVWASPPPSLHTFLVFGLCIIAYQGIWRLMRYSSRKLP